MARLSPVIAVAALAACDDKAAPPSRVNAVTAEPAPASVDDLCEVHHAAAAAPAFALPELARGEPPAVAGWRWVNVWATWCKPCIEEMPRLHRWRERLARGDRSLTLVFVSADESDDDIAAFRAAHPEIPDGARLADPEALPAWLTSIGLDGGAPIPIHVVVDPAGRTRCVRAAGVRETDFDAVERLLGTP
jgi:thiol-disulfide isomerase/thioredoxin